MSALRPGRSSDVLVAPDSFKGTFDAAAVAATVARGIEAAGLRADRCPVADGGEGTMAILVAQCGGSTADVRVHDPLGRPVDATLGLLDDGATAIVEVAQASGLGLVAPEERDAEAAGSGGTGELIAAAAALGARRVVVTVGGSATTDGGAGALAAIDAAGGLAGVELIALCDVTTPFERAAAVFGPQKGADAAAVERLTARLDALALTLPRSPHGVPMTGAAGGLAGGLWAVHGARLVSGAAWVLDAVGFDTRLAASRAAVTGEGRLDRQTFAGKLVGEVADRCRRAGRPLHAVVGSCALAGAEVQELGIASVAEATTLADLERAGTRVAQLISPATTEQMT